MFSHDKKLEKQPVTFGLSTEQKKLNNVDFEEKTEIEKNGKEIENKNENKQQKQQQQSVVKTKRICDYFIDALITGLDNWKWQCPNGQYCIYKHSLPSGYIICKKEEVKQIEDFVNEIDDKNDSFQQEPQSFFQQPIQKPIPQRPTTQNKKHKQNSFLSLRQDDTSSVQKTVFFNNSNDVPAQSNFIDKNKLMEVGQQQMESQSNGLFAFQTNSLEGGSFSAADQSQPQPILDLFYQQTSTSGNSQQMNLFSSYNDKPVQQQNQNKIYQQYRHKLQENGQQRME